MLIPVSRGTSRKVSSIIWREGFLYCLARRCPLLYLGRTKTSASHPACPYSAPPASLFAALPKTAWLHVKVLDPARFPGHALHEKGLQRQKCVGSLVRSQEQIALFVLSINRLSTANKPVVNQLFFSDMPCVKRVYINK